MCNLYFVRTSRAALARKFMLSDNRSAAFDALPAIYRQWTGPIKKDGPNVDPEVFSFMTTLPNTLTATINHERSPVLLTEEEQLATWLTGTPEEAFGLIKTSDPERMQIVQPGFEKKDQQQAA